MLGQQVDGCGSKSGAHAGVIIWPDAFGLRPAMRDIGKRIAADGYTVLVPNPYYRAGKAGTFDLVFIDADKTNYENYYERALVLLRKGGVVAADNVLWNGTVIDDSVQDADTQSIRAFNRKVHSDTRVAISMATMGDGLTLACKL